MNVKVEETELEGVLLVTPELFVDQRGVFQEVYRKDVYAEVGLPSEFVQLNQSRSRHGVVRGLHFQWDPPMGKLMRVVEGKAFVVAVDIRTGSPALGRWFGVELSEDSPTQMWAPAGFARGFCVLSEFAQVEYLCTATYNAPCESGIRWNDPEIGISWPVDTPLLSERDREAQTLAHWLADTRSEHLSL